MQLNILFLFGYQKYLKTIYVQESVILINATILSYHSMHPPMN